MVKCRNLVRGAEIYGAAMSGFLARKSACRRSSGRTTLLFCRTRLDGLRDEKRRGAPRALKAERDVFVNKPLVKISIRAENERTILEAAEAVFAEHGFGGATTAAIAARAGVPKANLHYYFPTKAALYRAVIERVLTAWLAAASSFDESDDPARSAGALHRREDGSRPRRCRWARKSGRAKSCAARR